MALRPPGSGDDWTQFKIQTPALELSPIEKADMSPFLFHMTGPQEIMRILRGEGGSGRKATGFLKSFTPRYSGTEYDAKIVCFTESPTFALDSFRYISFKRWESDLRFGLGFSKIALAQKQVRPAIYADVQLLQALFAVEDKLRPKVASIDANDNKEQSDMQAEMDIIYNIGIEEGARRHYLKQLGLDKDFSQALRRLITTMYPLVCPLAHNSPKQGFMWEREWRFPSETGFEFPYDSIKVICCPEAEEAQIRTILGEAASGIQFIRTWRQYDDISQFLHSQQARWKQIEQGGDKKKEVAELKEAITERNQALNVLESREELLRHYLEELERVRQQKVIVIDEREDLEARLHVLEPPQSEEDGNDSTQIESSL